jgi:LruC domain-containing protein
MKARQLLPICLSVLFSGCLKKDFPPAPAAEKTIENMQAQDGFTFNTAEDISLRITTLDNADNPVPAIRLTMYTDYPENGGKAISSFFTGSNGIYQGLLKMPADADSLVVETHAIGFVQWQKRKIVNRSITCVLGGSAPVEVRRPRPGGSAELQRPLPIILTGGIKVQPINDFNGAGVPAALSLPNDVVNASFLTDINNALPESRPVPSYHPEYLTSTNQTNLVFQQQAQVWVTFVHEGAGYRNVLCYYKYRANNPPASPSAIDTLYAVFPNTSYVNSGGGLVSGNKVEIGTFEPGMAIGWALIADGYNGSTITKGNGIYYSQSELNPETNASLKKHCILLNDLNRGKLLLSFEDINRQQGGCDNDFNDAIFYVSANPILAIATSEVARPAYTTIDADNDGATDNFDDYPNDASRAFNNYYPAENTYATLAFEDLWPSRGDYDMNDMILDYNFNTVTNAANKIVQINATIKLKAIGASYHSGFGIQLPVNTNLVSSVTGTSTSGTLITRNGNGTEAGQSKATIIVFEDAYNEMRWPGGGIGVNTSADAPYVQPKVFNVQVNFTSPVNASVLGLPPHNPFIFTNRTRGNEVHLINQPPTDLANTALFGTQADNSNPAAGRYYVTAKNLPFAIDIAGEFSYPIEKKVITETYLMFYEWGVSGGTQKKDWYKPVGGYRKTENVFGP